MAEQKQLKLTISKIDAPVFDGDVMWVTLPGLAGEMTLLANHEPLISPLAAGTITIETTDGHTQTYTIDPSGTLEISNNHATILI